VQAASRAAGDGVGYGGELLAWAERSERTAPSLLHSYLEIQCRAIEDAAKVELDGEYTVEYWYGGNSDSSAHLHPPIGRVEELELEVVCATGRLASRAETTLVGERTAYGRLDIAGERGGRVGAGERERPNAHDEHDKCSHKDGVAGEGHAGCSFRLGWEGGTRSDTC
jgi:hypothetical protein